MSSKAGSKPGSKAGSKPATPEGGGLTNTTADTIPEVKVDRTEVEKARPTSGPPALLPEGALRIKELAENDPKFITRLINQLDKSMERMQMQRRFKLQEIDADMREIEEIDNTTANFIVPRLEATRKGLKKRVELRDHLKEQLDRERKNFTSLERSAAALIREATHKSRTLGRTNASGLMQEQRGYTMSISTKDYINGTAPKKGSSRGSTPGSIPGKRPV